jgi:anti-sigma-K factor RskA
VFGAGDVQVKDVAIGTGEVHVAVSHRLGYLAVDGSDMPAPPAGHAYQLWLVHQDGHATSLSVMEGSNQTAADPIPSGGVLAVTVEPSGGSPAPTTSPVLTLDPADL